MSRALRLYRRAGELRAPRPRRVLLLGTTAGTTWRKELTAELIGRGVHESQIIDTHHSGRYDKSQRELERRAKRDSHTLALVYVCPAAPRDDGPSPDLAAFKRELLGPITMFEMGKMAYWQPWRLGIVLDYQQFTDGKRPQKVLQAISAELHEDFGGGMPNLHNLGMAADWIVRRLVKR